MNEEWIEDDLPWLDPGYSGPVPPASRPTDPPEPAGVLPRRASAAYPTYPPVPRPRPRVPPFAQQRGNRHSPSSYRALTIGGIVLVLLALVATLVLLISSRNDGDNQSSPPLEMVIAIGTAGQTEVPVSAPTITKEERFAGTVICIDPAHGGNDRGNQRPGNPNAPAMDESFYTLALSRELGRRLTERGFTVVVTREDDSAVNSQFQDVNRDGNTRESGATEAESDAFATADELQARIDRCNDARANLLLSIHFDGVNDAIAAGFETWFAEDRPDTQLDQQLAQFISEELTNQLGALGYGGPNRGVNGDSQANQDPHAFEGLFVLAATRDGMKEPSTMPGALVELLTLQNDQDAQLLASGEGRAAMLAALDRAVVRYFEQNPLTS